MAYLSRRTEVLDELKGGSLASTDEFSQLIVNGYPLLP